MSMDPYAGVNVDLSRYYNPQVSDALGDSQYEDLETYMQFSDAMGMATSLVGDAAEMMPEMVTESAMQPGTTGAQIGDEFHDVNVALNYQQQAMMYEYVLEDMGDWRDRQRLWDQLDPDVRRAMEAEGMTRPEDPSPGGIQIPFTSILKRGANALGADFDPGNIELFGGTDNFITTGIHQGLRTADIVPAMVREGGSQVFSALNFLEDNLISRPLAVGQTVREETFGQGMGGPFGGGDLGNQTAGQISGTTLIRQGAGIAGSAASFFGGLFTGRSQELWALYDERDARIRPEATAEALDMLGGDEDLLLFAQVYMLNNGNVIKAVEELAGEPPGSPQFVNTFEMAMRALDEETGNPALFDAIEHLSQNKVGFQHDMAETAGFEQGTWQHTVYSVGAELGVLMIADPTLVGGKINRIRKAANVAVNSGQLFGQLDRGRRLWEIARVVDRGDDAMDAATVTARIWDANSRVVSSLRNSRWQRMLVREESQLQYGRDMNRFMERVARAADDTDAYDWRQLVQDVPGAAYMRQELVIAAEKGLLTSKVEDGVRNTDNIWDYFQGAIGSRTLISGATGRDPRLMYLPTVTANSERWAGVKNWVQRKIDLGEMVPSDMRDDIESVIQRATKGEIGKDELLRSVVRFDNERSMLERASARWFMAKPLINRFVKQTPRRPYIRTAIGDVSKPTDMRSANQAILEFERFVEFGDIVQMPRAVKDNYIQAFTVGNQGERYALVNQVMAEFAIRSGLVESSDEMAEMFAKFSIRQNTNYTTVDIADDITRYGVDAMAGRGALWHTQIADHISIPTYIDFKRAAIKRNALREFGASGFNSFDNFFQRFMKPSYLFRAAFIARAGGDESVSTMLRLGPMAYARAQWGRRWAMGTVTDKITGARVPVRQQNYTARFIRNQAYHIKRNRKTLPDQQMDQVLNRLDPDSLARLRQLEDLRSAKGVPSGKVDEYSAAIHDITQPVIDDYMKNLPRRSQWLNTVADVAADWSIRNSERMFDISRKLRLPSRQQLGSAVLGRRVIGFTSDNAPIYAEAPTFFGLRRRTYATGVNEQVSGELLLAANHQALNNPVIARMVATYIGDSFSPYKVEDLQKFTNSALLTNERRYRTITMNGKPVYIPMRTKLQGWEDLDILSRDGRRAIGNAMRYPAQDPAFRDSGALDVLGSFMADDMIDVLRQTVRSKGKIQSRDAIEELVNTVRRDLYEVMAADNRPVVTALREAIYLGDDIPVEVMHAVPSIEPLMPLLNNLDPIGLRLRGLIHPEMGMLRQPIRRNLDDTLAEVHQRMWYWMQRPDYQPTLSALQDMARRRNLNIVEPLPTDQTRLYGLSIRGANLDLLDEIGQDPDLMQDFINEVRAVLVRQGGPDFEVDDFLDELLPGGRLNPEWFRHARDAGENPAEEFTIATNMFFADPDSAVAASDALDRAIVKMQQARQLPDMAEVRIGRTVDMGYFDVPNELMRPHRGKITAVDTSDYGAARVFRLGEEGSVGVDPGLINNFRRINPDHRVVFHQTADNRWIPDDVYQAMRESARPPLTGVQQWASGMTEHAARRELHQRRFDDAVELFVTSGDQTLTEVLGHLKTGTFDPQYHTMAIPVDDLPTNAWAPILMEEKDIWWDRFISGYFSEVVDPIIMGVARNPLFNINFAASLEAADDWYHSVTTNTRNDEIIDIFLKAGFSEEDIGILVDEIHATFRNSALYDPDGELLSQAARGMAALSGDVPNQGVEEAVDEFVAGMAGVLDNRARAAGQILDDADEARFLQEGEEMTTLEETQLSNRLYEDIETEFEGPAVLQARWEELEEERRMLEEILGPDSHFPRTPVFTGPNGKPYYAEQIEAVLLDIAKDPTAFNADHLVQTHNLGHVEASQLLEWIDDQGLVGPAYEHLKWVDDYIDPSEAVDEALVGPGGPFGTYVVETPRFDHPEKFEDWLSTQPEIIRDQVEFHIYLNTSGDSLARFPEWGDQYWDDAQAGYLGGETIPLEDDFGNLDLYMRARTSVLDEATIEAGWVQETFPHSRELLGERPAPIDVNDVTAYPSHHISDEQGFVELPDIVMPHAQETLNLTDTTDLWGRILGAEWDAVGISSPMTHVDPNVPEFSEEAMTSLGNWYRMTGDNPWPSLYLDETERSGILPRIHQAFREEFGDTVVVRRGALVGRTNRVPTEGLTNASILPSWYNAVLPDNESVRALDLVKALGASEGEARRRLLDIYDEVLQVAFPPEYWDNVSANAKWMLGGSELDPFTDGTSPGDFIRMLRYPEWDADEGLKLLRRRVETQINDALMSADSGNVSRMVEAQEWYESTGLSQYVSWQDLWDDADRDAFRVVSFADELPRHVLFDELPDEYFQGVMDELAEINNDFTTAWAEHGISGRLEFGHWVAEVPVENIVGLGARNEGEVFVRIDRAYRPEVGELVEQRNQINHAIYDLEQRMRQTEFARETGMRAHNYLALTDDEINVTGRAEKLRDLLEKPHHKDADYTNWEILQQWAANRHYRYQEAIDSAAMKAIDMTVEFIDDHRFRSQFQQTVRNLMPFHFAEEQFIKRQIRMIVDSPESIRRGSLLMNAGRHMGIIQEDEQGNEIVVWPGTEFINSEIVQYAGILTGFSHLEPYGEPMAPRTSWVLPGWTDNRVEGGTGPMVGFVASMLSHQWPELVPLENAILRADVARGRHPIEHLMPPAAQRILNAAGINTSVSSDRMLSAQIRSTQIAIANGDAPPPDADPRDMQAFIDRTKNHARIINVVDALMYMTSPLPAGSGVRYGDAEMSDEFRTIVFESGMPFAEGMALFFELNPDATVWTVFGTESTTGASIATDSRAYEYLDEYSGLIDAYPQAASWLMPPASEMDDDDYSRRAQAELLAMELKRRRSPEEFLDEYYVRMAAGPYYEVRNQFAAEIYEARQRGDTELVRTLEQQQQLFKEGYYNLHPIFREHEVERAGQERREQTKLQRDAILAMPRASLPQGGHQDAMLELMRNHKAFNDAMASLSHGRGTTEQRRAYRREFMLWAVDFIRANPTTAQYFGSHIRWDGDIVEDEALIIEIEAMLGRDL